MNLYRSLDQIPFDQNSVLTLGTFDGVHNGHRALIDQLNRRADELGARPVVVTFAPHPQLVLKKPGAAPLQVLHTVEERLEHLREAGVRNLLVIDFTTEFAQLEAESFLARYLLDGIGCRHILVGHDHGFGKDRQGNLELMERLSRERNFEIERVSALEFGEQAVSSTRIRTLLSAGDVDAAADLLGYDFHLRGTVIEGDGRGRTIGIPTANIYPGDKHKLIPGRGVYCVAARIHEQNSQNSSNNSSGAPAAGPINAEKEAQIVWGMANIGTRPTFTDDVALQLEVNLFDWKKMIYNATVDISFLKFIRKERKFASLDSFLSQIDADRRLCSEYTERLQADLIAGKNI